MKHYLKKIKALHKPDNILPYYFAVGAWVAYGLSLLLPAVNMPSLGPAPGPITGLFIPLGALASLMAVSLIALFVILVHSLLIWTLICLTNNRTTPAWSTFTLLAIVIFMGFAGVNPKWFSSYGVEFFMIGHYALMLCIIFGLLGMLRLQTNQR